MEIKTAGYYDWHKKREEIPVSALVGGIIVQFDYGNNFIVSNNGKYYEIMVDETAGNIDIIDITKLQTSDE